MLYLSGQVGNIPGEMEVVPGGIGPETRQTMENIKAVLERYGSSMDKVVKCLCMLEDINEWAAMSAEYVKFFPTHKPARSAFAGTGLVPRWRLNVWQRSIKGGNNERKPNTPTMAKYWCNNFRRFHIGFRRRSKPIKSCNQIFTQRTNPDDV
jgi:hypothetical protein